MNGNKTSKSGSVSEAKSTVGRLIVLELSEGRIFSVDSDGQHKKFLVTNGKNPDGVSIDTEAGHIYWTNMGNPILDDGSLERVDLDGQNRRLIIPAGVTFTPKQMHLDKAARKLYWSDREGMRVMRANLDGSEVEVLVDTSKGDSRPGNDQTKWCVGITHDPKNGHFYWTQKGSDDGNVGIICRADDQMPKGETAATRTDIEVLFDGLPEPIDLELDLEHRMLYWTDRGDPPRGNTVNRAPVDVPAKSIEPEIVFTHLMEGIGIALDVPNDRMFMTDLTGTIFECRLDGSEKRTILMTQGNLTGIAYYEPK